MRKSFSEETKKKNYFPEQNTTFFSCFYFRIFKKKFTHKKNKTFFPHLVSCMKKNEKHLTLKLWWFITERNFSGKKTKQKMFPSFFFSCLRKMFVCRIYLVILKTESNWVKGNFRGTKEELLSLENLIFLWFFFSLGKNFVQSVSHMREKFSG